MRAPEGFLFSNQAAGTLATMQVTGGYYQRSAHATWGGGNVALQQLLPDGATWLALGSALSADGVDYFYLPPGQYRFVITTSSAVYVALARVPFE